MKKSWIFLVLVILSCSNTPLDKDNAPSIEQIREFKIVFFKNCLNLSSKNKCVKDFISQDISTTSDFGLGLKNYKLIDSLVKIVAHNIYTDSIERTSQMCKECDEATLIRMKHNGMIGKQTFGFCLDYYTSPKLDSIARANVRK